MFLKSPRISRRFQIVILLIAITINTAGIVLWRDAIQKSAKSLNDPNSKSLTVPTQPIPTSDISNPYDLIQVLPIPEISQSPRNSRISKIYMFDNTIQNTINPYKVCHMQNVCQRASETLFYVETRRDLKLYESLYSSCCVNFNNTATTTQTCPLVGKQRLFCGCFSPESRLVFKLANSLKEFQKRPAWMISQWLQTKKHHIAHFTYSVVQVHSILQHRRELMIPDPHKFDTIVFQDGVMEFNQYERDLWEIIATGANLTNIQNFNFLRQLKWKDQKEQDRNCFQNMYSTIRGDIYATCPEDLDAFKNAASAHLNLPLLTNISTCPTRRIAILTRESGMGLRKMINLPKVIRLLKKLFKVSKVDVVSPSEAMTLRTQAELMSRYGIIVSSHSSQLTNMLYMQANSVVVEVAPVYKRAFRHLGEMSRLKYINSFSHTPVNIPAELDKKFRKVRVECEMERMLEDAEFRCGLSKDEHVALSRSDYMVDLKRLASDLREVVDGFSACAWNDRFQ